jgi:hypothetical protein
MNTRPTADELKAKLPLPDLMAVCGDGDRAKKSARSPFRDETNPSFSVFQTDGRWFWKDFATDEGGDEITYLQKRFGIDTSTAFTKYAEFAGFSNGTHHGKNGSPKHPQPTTPPPPAQEKSNGADYSATWAACVAGLNDDRVSRIATWRGLSLPCVNWLRGQGLIGLHRGSVAFPVIEAGGKVIGAHIRLKDGSWRYDPNGNPVSAFILGNPAAAETVAVFESQWDLLAAADLMGLHRGLPGWAFVATRGASNAKLAGNLLRQGAALYAFPQNDPPGRKWADELVAAIGRPVRMVATPEPHKDVNDWMRAGATLADLGNAIEGATEAKPEPVKTKLSIVSAPDLCATDFPEAEDLVEGIWQVGSKAILSGVAKLGKTLFMFALLLMVATGKSRMGFRVGKRPRRVLIFQAEVTARNVKARLQKMLPALSADESLLRENFLICNDPRLKLTNGDALAAIREAIEAHKPEVVAFDPAYKFHTGDENSVKEMTVFFDVLDTLAADYGVSILLTHHHGKGSGEGLSTAAHRNRGSSCFADWPDTLLTLTFEGAEKAVVRLDFTLRNAEEPEPLAFCRNPATLWFEPVPGYEFGAKGRNKRISPTDVADLLGDRSLFYTPLAEELAKRFDVSPRTAKAAITTAAAKGVIVKNLQGSYGRA